MTDYSMIILGIAGLILTGAGLLVNKIWRDSETNNKNLQSTLTILSVQVGKLSVSVAGLGATVLAQTEDSAGFKVACRDHKLVVAEKLKAHDEKLDKHDVAIAVLQEKTNQSCQH